MFAVIDDQTYAGGLATLAGATASWNDGHLQVAANGHGGGYFLGVLGYKHTQRRHLVNGGVGGVAAAVGGRKQHFALSFRFQTLGQEACHLIAGSGNLLVCFKR